MNIDRGREAGYTVEIGAQTGAPGPDSRTRDEAAQIPLETRWLYSRLHAVCNDVERALTDYRFDEASQAVYQFFWGEFCDWYLELIKLRLDFSAPGNATTQLSLNALVSAFESALRLLSPFMPFLTEELWHALYASIEQPSPAKSIALTRYPQANEFAADLASVSAMETLQELIVTVRGLRKELAVPEKEATPIQVFAPVGAAATLAAANADMLAKQARVSAVEVATSALAGNNARSTAAFDVAVIYERQIDVAAERERLTKDLAKFTKGLEAAERQLGSESFLAKAPANIVDGLKKQAAETKALKQKAEEALAQLG
jgi:valyl-tRNA synthetase